eukprot:TRINITY_DN9920_c0_g1_i1.p1 TRINITY_DN9920_c0_g1~~TRINITY_DN9920_c0_g1_i1.p1  ORF type:complete len:419 (-),score=64.70 TRINITY_DN9920_c0_g1_i1:69-1295(-)
MRSARLKDPECNGFSSDDKSETGSTLSQAMTRSILELESESSLMIKQTTVYSASLVIPQVARTAGWSKTTMVLVIRVYFCLLINYCLQFSLVYFIYDELNSLNRFAGRPSLCNFGAQMWRCPNGPDCVGPGGTTISPEQLYSFNVWQTRSFLRDSLLSLFPERADDISSHVQPGEYGVESQYCRVLCCFIFCIVVMEELYELWSFLQLLYHLPGRAQDWAEYQNYKLTFRLAGMSYPWKVVNMFVLFTPRLLLFKSVTYCGINFLMETPDITSMIVNVTAMSFLLQIDELIFTHFLSHTTQHMLENLKEFEPGSASRSRDQEESEEDDFVAVRRQDFVRLVPWRMIFTVGALFTFLAEYYHAHCELQEDGSWVSAPLYLPSTILYNPICIFVECQQGGAELVWQMPKT